MEQLPSDAELLDLWERGLVHGPARRALALLASAEPRADANGLEELTVGQRDAGLLRLRERSFGQRLAFVAMCPGCREQVEASVPVAALQVPSPPAAEVAVSAADWQLVVRAPTAGDLVELEGAADVEEGRRMLLERCLVSASVAGAEAPVAAVPDEVVAAAAARLADADPQADVQLALRCPACGASWDEPFDPGDFLWRELDSWVRRFVRDVDELATAYGWREEDVLALPPARRRLYLELAAE